MKTISKLHLALVLAAAMFTTSVFAGPGARTPNDLPRKISTKEEAMSCCVPKAHVALACPDCKTLNVKKGEDKKDILAWFAPDSKHDCSGCGGKITVKQGEKSGTTGAYKHVCSKCGKGSPYVCTDHKKA